MIRLAPILLCIAVAILVVIGMAMMTSTSAWVRGIEEPYYFLQKQGTMVALGILGAVLVAQLPMEWLRKHAFYLWLISIILLALCFAPGVGVEFNDSKRWVRLPGLPQFQPSELAKVALMIGLAAYFARWATEIRTFWRGFVIPGLIAACPALLILIETDAGTALALGATAGVLMFCVGTRWLYLIPTAVAGVAGAGFFLVTDANRWRRIEAWLDLDNPELFLGINMQQHRALMALENGGIAGVGLGNGIEKLGALSLAHSDFILPVIGEELGLAGTLAVTVCFIVIAISGGAIALQAKPLFHRCLALGLTCILVVPGMMHIAVTTAMLPNDGVPLPFVSYGGTSVMISLLIVGQLIAIHRQTHVARVEEFPLGKKHRFAVKL